MDCQNLVFSRHAIQQMFLRQISKRDVQAVVAYGEVVEDNPDDTPFPSYLLLDFVGRFMLYFPMMNLQIRGML